jgi:hypothetical protein
VRLKRTFKTYVLNIKIFRRLKRFKHQQSEYSKFDTSNVEILEENPFFEFLGFLLSVLKKKLNLP